MASKDVFVGRDDSFEELRRALSPRRAGEAGFFIQSVEGPGGIGKTFLLDHVLTKCDLENQPAVVIRVDGLGGNTLRAIVQSLISNAKFRGTLVERTHFPETEKVLKQMLVIEEHVRKGIAEQVPEDEDAVRIALAALDTALATGQAVNTIVPKSSEYVNCSPENAEAVRQYMATAAMEAMSLIDRLGLNSAKELRNRIRSGATEVIAEALVEDLRRTISGKGATLKPSKPKLVGATRLVLILDDYEALAAAVGPLLTNNLLPELRRLTDFSTVVVLLGRDRLTVTSTEWDHHFAGAMGERIVLEQLTREDLDDYFDAVGIDVDPATRELAWIETQGYPFYLYLWLEEHNDGGESAVMLTRFYERTTKWMREDREKKLEWLHAVVFLDKIDLRTLKQVTGDSVEAARALKWFMSEPSIRDTKAKHLTVRPYIRGRVARYVEMIDPELAQTLKRKAAKANRAGAVADEA